jgi:heme-degrading monooxygenase HmoA
MACEAKMILETALLNIRPGQEAAFAAAMAEAKPLILASRGFNSIELRPCIEQAGRYLLLVSWDSLEDHIEGFRGSENYRQWKALLHHFYDPFPVVEHFAESII